MILLLYQRAFTITAPSLVSTRDFFLRGIASPLEGLFVALLTSPTWLAQTNCSLPLSSSSTFASSLLRRPYLSANRKHFVQRYPDPKCAVASGKSIDLEIERRVFLESAPKVRRELLTETPSPQALQRSISHVGLVLLLFTRFQYSCSVQDRDATSWAGRFSRRSSCPTSTRARPGDLRTAPAPIILYVTSERDVSNVMQLWIQTGIGSGPDPPPPACLSWKN